MGGGSKRQKHPKTGEPKGVAKGKGRQSGRGAHETPTIAQCSNARLNGNVAGMGQTALGATGIVHHPNQSTATCGRRTIHLYTEAVHLKSAWPQFVRVSMGLRRGCSPRSVNRHVIGHVTESG